jgi:hypothetical protein
MSDETVYKAQREKLGMGMQVPLPAALLIGGGLLLLVANFLNISLMTYLWPGFVIGSGLLLMWPAQRSTAANQNPFAFLAVPGAILLMIGVALFIFNLTGRFESMAYTWPLFLAAAAGGLMYMNRSDEQRSVHESGRRFIRAMVILFIGLAAVFELLIFRSFGGWWPLALVALGIYLMVRERGNKQSGVMS